MGWIRSGQTPSLFICAPLGSRGQARGDTGTPPVLHESQSYGGNAWALFIPSMRNSLGFGSTGLTQHPWDGNTGMSRTQSSPNRRATPTLSQGFPSPCPFHIPSRARNSFSPSLQPISNFPKPWGDPSSSHWFGIANRHWDEMRAAREHPAPLPGRIWAIPGRIWIIPERTWGISQKDKGVIPGRIWIIPGKTWNIPGRTWVIPREDKGVIPGRTWATPGRIRVIPGRIWVIPGRTNFVLQHLWLGSTTVPSKLQLSCAPPALLTTPWAPEPPVSLSDWSQCFASREFREFPRGVKPLGDSWCSGTHRERGTAGAFLESFPKTSQEH